MRNSYFTPLSDIFPKIAQKHNVASQLSLAHTCHVANSILEELGIRKGKPATATAIDLKNNNLCITVTSSVVAQQIALNKLEIMNRLRKKDIYITSIRTILF